MGSNGASYDCPVERGFVGSCFVLQTHARCNRGLKPLAAAWGNGCNCPALWSTVASAFLHPPPRSIPALALRRILANRRTLRDNRADWVCSCSTNLCVTPARSVGSHACVRHGAQSRAKLLCSKALCGEACLCTRMRHERVPGQTPPGRPAWHPLSGIGNWHSSQKLSRRHSLASCRLLMPTGSRRLRARDRSAYGPASQDIDRTTKYCLFEIGSGLPGIRLRLKKYVA